MEIPFYSNLWQKTQSSPGKTGGERCYLAYTKGENAVDGVSLFVLFAWVDSAVRTKGGDGLVVTSVSLD